MAGHNKWSKIKHTKAVLDAKRGKSFTKLIKEITIAARQGGGDPAGNPRLRQLLEKAREVNMPQDNSVRAIKRGTGELPGVSYERFLYEGYGPGNIGVLVDVLTDNKNKAVAEMRTTFNKKGGILAEAGAISWMFDKLGVVRVPKIGLTEDKLMELLLEHAVKDIKEEENFVITTDAKALDEVRQALNTVGIKTESAELEWVAKDLMPIEDAEVEQKAHDFLTALEDLDDVQNVYTNLD